MPTADADGDRDDVLDRAAELAAGDVRVGVRPGVAGVAGLLQLLGGSASSVQATTVAEYLAQGHLAGPGSGLEMTAI